MRGGDRWLVWLGFWLILAAWAGNVALAQEPILIGAVGPLSQPGAVQAGLDMRWAVETAVADVNAAGGVLGRPLQIIFYDTQNQPNVAASVAERLVSRIGWWRWWGSTTRVPSWLRVPSTPGPGSLRSSRRLGATPSPAVTPTMPTCHPIRPPSSGLRPLPATRAPSSPTGSSSG